MKPHVALRQTRKPWLRSWPSCAPLRRHNSTHRRTRRCAFTRCARTGNARFPACAPLTRVHWQPAQAAAAPVGAQDQWSSNPFFDTAPHSAPPARNAAAAAPPSYGATPYGAGPSYGALPSAPHTVGAVGGASTRAQAAAAEQAAMDVINLINKPHSAPVPYMVGTDPSPAAARAAAALAQARARMRSREGGAGPASGSAPFEDGLSSVTRARQLLDSIGAESGAARRASAGPVAGLLAQAGGDDLT